MTPRIKMTLEFPVKIFKEEDWYVGWCPVLDVASQGDTPEEAREHVREAIIGFLVSCSEHGTLDTVFRDCGFSPVLSEEFDAAKLEEIEATGETIDVPLYLLAKHAGSNQCHHA